MAKDQCSVRFTSCGRYLGGGSCAIKKCIHCCATNHDVDFCWKLHGKPWANQATLEGESSTLAHTQITMSKTEYDSLIQRATVSPTSTATHVTTGVQWSLPNKVSALPHFLSFKVAQEEKAAKSTSDYHASAGFMAISTADVFDTTHKRQMQKARNGQGDTHFSMTIYPEQHNAVSMHLSPDHKMEAANQPVSVPISYPYLKTQFIGKQHLLGGTTFVEPHSSSPLGSVAQITEPWFISKSSPQLTIFYAGRVNVYDDISPEKAQAIMFLAGNKSKMAQSRAQAPAPVSEQAGGGHRVPVSGLSSPMSVFSQPVGQSGNGTSINDELMGIKPTRALGSQISKANPQNVVTALAPLAVTTMLASAVPQARRASLARFLEKRKERLMNSVPYPSKKSSECSS